jgi:hypothetical protein
MLMQNKKEKRNMKLSTHPPTPLIYSMHYHAEEANCACVHAYYLVFDFLLSPPLSVEDDNMRDLKPHQEPTGSKTIACCMCGGDRGYN